MSDDKWIQKANRRMKRKGTVGKFTAYCGGKVTNECIDRALKSNNPTLVKRAQFAKNVRKKQEGGALEFLGDGIDFSDGSESIVSDAATGMTNMGGLKGAIQNFKMKKQNELLEAGGMEGIKDFVKDGIKGGLKSLKPSMGTAVAALSGLAAKSAENKAGKSAMADPFRNNVMERKAAKRAGFGAGFKAASDGAVGQALGKIPVFGKVLQAGAGVVGGLIGGKKAQKQQEKDRKEAVKQLRTSQNAQLAQQAAQAKQFETSGETGFADVGTSITNSYLAQRGMRDGGSYDPVYSGTKLKGGRTEPLPGGAVEFVGKKHSEGGIMLDPKTEVEGGETMDKVYMKKKGGKKTDYIFSDYLKLGGKTFAQRHKELLHGGASQKQIQQLAKMQEDKAGRTPKVMQFGGETSMYAGGQYRKFQEAGDAQEPVEEQQFGPREGEVEIFEGDPGYPEDAKEGERFYVKDGEVVRETLNADGTAKRRNEVKSWSEGKLQERTGENLFSGVTEKDVDKRLKDEAHWVKDVDFGEGGFDVHDTAKVKKYQQEYNKRVPDDQKIEEDGKWGDQTQSATIPQGPEQEREVRREEKQFVEEPDPEDDPGDEEDPGDDPGDSTDVVKKIKTKEVPTLAQIGGLGQLIPPIYAFKSQPAYISGPGAASVVAPNMPRVNLNAERSANANDFRAVQAAIEGSGGGPGAMVNMMVNLENKNKNDLQIANAENRANKELAAEEKRMKFAASSKNAELGLQAGQFAATLAREQIKDRREEKLGALDAMADRLAGYAGDVLEYRAQERLASEIGADGIYEAQQLRDLGYTQEQINAYFARKDQEKKEGQNIETASAAISRNKLKPTREDKISAKDQRAIDAGFESAKDYKKQTKDFFRRQKINDKLEADEIRGNNLKRERELENAARVADGKEPLPPSQAELRALNPRRRERLEKRRDKTDKKKGGYIRRAKAMRRKRRR